MKAGSFFVGGMAAAFGLIGVIQTSERAAADPILGSADAYAVLGQTAVTISGAGATITGNVGSPTSVTGGAGITFTGIGSGLITAGSVDNADASSALAAANGAATFLNGFGSP